MSTTSRKVKCDTPDAGVSTKRMALSPSQPYSKSCGRESERLFAMFMGWVLVWYGVRRRDLTGTVTAMAGLGLSIGALITPERANHNSYGKRP